MSLHSSDLVILSQSNSVIKSVNMVVLCCADRGASLVGRQVARLGTAAS